MPPVVVDVRPDRIRAGTDSASVSSGGRFSSFGLPHLG